MSRNKFEIYGDRISISHSDWDFVASASVKEDYAEELQSVTWSKNGEYLYSSKLKEYLHVYIMRKWYGDETYEKMKEDGYVVDHMDNDGHNCCIENLCFLISDENKAKGMTVDKMSSDKSHIALSMFKDFDTKLFQITIFFNYPAKLILSNLERPAALELAFFLYDCEYEMVINDARAILYDYRRDFSFAPEKLHCIDYHMEGSYGTPIPVEYFDEYQSGIHGNKVVCIVKKSPLKGWNKDEKRRFFVLREPIKRNQ